MAHRATGPAGTLFRLVRNKDNTGVSGTGHVASGVKWPDGSVTLKWHTTATDPANVSHFANMDKMLAVHGHKSASYPYGYTTSVAYVGNQQPLTAQVTKSVGDLTWAVGNFAEQAEKGLSPDASTLKRAFSELLDLVQS